MLHYMVFEIHRCITGETGSFRQEAAVVKRGGLLVCSIFYLNDAHVHCSMLQIEKEGKMPVNFSVILTQQLTESCF